MTRAPRRERDAYRALIETRARSGFRPGVLAYTERNARAPAREGKPQAR